MSTVNIPENLPDFNEAPFRGSIQQLLSYNIGKRATVEFMVGTCTMLTVTGVIIGVGVQFILLETDNCKVVSGDNYSIKRITFC